jgi:trigger factor
LNISLQETAPLQHTITIEVISDDYSERVRKSLADISRKANMPGFRPGKVPVGIVRKMYGQEVLREQLNKILQESIDQYINENKIQLLGYPLPIPADIIDFDPDKGHVYTFQFEIGRQPEINLNLNLSGLVDYQVELDNDYLDKELKLLQNRFGKMTNTEVAESGDYLFGKIEEVDANGKVVEGGISNKFTLNPNFLDTLPSKDFPKGIKIGEVISLDLNKLLKGTKKRAMMLGMTLNRYNLEGQSKKIQFTVEKINHYEPAEINEELFKKVFPGNDTPENEADFKSKLKESIEEYLNVEAKKLFVYELQEAIVAAHSFDLPESFLKKWLGQQEENKRTPEEIESSFPSWQQELRWSILKNSLIRHFDNLQVTEDEIRQEAKNRASQMLGGGMDEEQLEAFIPYFLKNEDSYNQMYEGLLQDKLISKLREAVSISNQSVTATQFNQL